MIVAVVLAALVAALVVWWQRDDRPRAEAGQQVGVRDGSHVSGYPTDVLLPFGRYRVTVSEAREEMPSPCCTDEPAPTRAPKGGSFVGIELTPDLVTGLPSPALVAQPDATPPDPELTLLVRDGYGEDAPVEEYPLDSFDGWWEGTRVVAPTHLVYVAIEGVPDADDLSVRIEFDGVSQVVQPDRLRVDRGDADALYTRRLADGAGGCGELRLPDGFTSDAPLDCSLERRETPYVAGLGWAAPGQVWLVVTAGTDPFIRLTRRAGERRHGYTSSGFAAAPVPIYSLDGQPPVDTWAVGNGRFSAAFAITDFAVYGRSLETALAYVDLETDDPRPVRPVEVAWDLVL